MLNKKTQMDHVIEDQGYKEKFENREIKLPGIESLHTKPTGEIAEVLANVLKSHANIVAIKWEIGKAINLTIEN